MLLTTLQPTRDPHAHLVQRHPCLSAEGHHKFGRLHLPVSPACNIQCRFCRRSFNKHERRPGVTRGLLTPDAAVAKVTRALELCPDITVVGIAGPGDTLATPHALETFRHVHAAFPDLIKCLSTNGLALPQNIDAIVQAGVRTVTVTVNAIDPNIQTLLCSGILHDGHWRTGQDAAKILIAAQLAGITQLATRNILVKINTVLVPGINDHHIQAIAQETAARGASRINLIPLIPQHDLSHLPAPTCAQLNTARQLAAPHLEVFRHCQHCRADACGIPGQHLDVSSALYDEPAVTTFSHG